jgi:hypothetical protein
MIRGISALEVLDIMLRNRLVANRIRDFAPRLSVGSPCSNGGQ